MPRTKTPSNAQNGAIEPQIEVMTLPEAATFLRVTSDEVLSLVDEQGLPGRQVGKNWRFLKLALQDWLKTSPSKKGILSFAGAIANDSHAVEMLESIYRERGRPATEERFTSEDQGTAILCAS